MKKKDVVKAFKAIGAGVSKRAPGIITGIGIAGFGVTVVLAVKATPKAVKLLEEEKKELKKEELTPVETVKAAWKPYIPAAVTGLASVACIIGASSVNARRNAAIATAYKLTETALSEYKDKVVETIGEEKEKEIRQKVAQDKINKVPEERFKTLVVGNGDIPFYDPISNVVFTSNPDKIDAAVAKLNRRLDYDEYVSLGDLQDLLGIERTGLSDILGWNRTGGDIDIYTDESAIINGQPCIVLTYLVEPRYEFYNLM